MISNILGDLRIPEPTAAQPEQAPPPIGFAENIRHAVTKDARTRLAYRLLHEHVSRENPGHEHNAQRLLGLCSSELTKAIILFLAEKDADREFDEADFPFEMIELEPKHWTLQEKSNFEMDLNQMTVRASGWGLLPPIVPRGPFPGFASIWVDFVDQNKSVEQTIHRIDRHRAYDEGRNDHVWRARRLRGPYPTQSRLSLLRRSRRPIRCSSFARWWPKASRGTLQRAWQSPPRI